MSRGVAPATTGNLVGVKKRNLILNENATAHEALEAAAGLNHE